VTLLVATYFALRDNVRRELSAQATIIIDNTKASLVFREPATETVDAPTRPVRRRRRHRRVSGAGPARLVRAGRRR
jgi:hypothetical protein